MLTAALSNTSCCSTRKATEQSRTEATETLTATERTESRNEEKRETTRTETTEGVTEIEIYDTAQPKDPETGQPPLKARVKQRHDRNGTSRTVEQATGVATAESGAALEYEGGELEEAKVTATKAPSLWERMKQGAAWATAILIPAAAGWIILRRAKR